jgi:hypothetical protein
VVRANEKLTAFLELEAAIRAAERPADCGGRDIKIDNCRISSKSLLDLRHPTFQRIFGRAEGCPWGWTFAETPLSAIPQIQLEPRVNRSEAAFSKRLVRMIPSSSRNWIAVNAVQQSNLKKNKDKKYETKKYAKFTVKKFD